MEQRIIGFHRDDDGDWVADLECGHGQHVRHTPPWSNRPWVVTREGREQKLHQRLQCRKCDDGEPASAAIRHSDIRGLKKESES